MTTSYSSTASIDDRHPSYAFYLPDWQVMEHVYAGERVVKDCGDLYLPATSGMVAQGYGQPNNDPRTNLGQKAYDAYRTRAVFHDFVREAVTGLSGMLHRKPPVIEVPKVLEPMLTNATVAGESIEALMRRITEMQLLYGRCGLLLDFPTGKDIREALPYLCLYPAPNIVNWDAGIRQQGRQMVELVVLDESYWERVAGLRWERRTQFRILSLSGVVEMLGSTNQDAPGEGVYTVGVVRLEGTSLQGATALLQRIDWQKAQWVVPRLGARTLDRVPFEFCNAVDLVPEPCIPPLLGLAKLTLAIYRGEADYRQALYMTGQDTLVREGANEEQQKTMTGAGAILDVPMGGDAKYIGVTGVGITEQRECLENDKAQASITSSRMLDRQKDDAESGEALKIRVSARTANLATLAMANAQCVKNMLMHAGRAYGLSDAELEKIKVEPNMDFTDTTVAPVEVNTLMDAKTKGLPLALESIHCWLAENEYTKLSYEEELEKIAEEQATLGINGQTEDDLDPFATDEEKAAAEEAKAKAKAEGKPPGKNGKGKKPPFGKKVEKEEEYE
jgi:hypothetical protein